MKVEQIKDILNSITESILGKSVVIEEDLSNVVDLGTEIFDATTVDNYVKTLVDKVGKVIFVDRQYSGSVPSVFMDSWEYGSITQKISAELPTAEENESWNLTDGTSYDVNVFHKPTVSNKFFNSKVTFEIPMSFTEMQVKSSFNSATELNAFLSMIVTAIENSMTVKIDSLIMRTINMMIAQTVHAEYPTGTGFEVSKVKAINLLTLYNDTVTTPIKVENALADENFMKFATYTINLYVDRLSKMSTLFNVGAKEKFTPSDQLTTVLLSDFKASSNAMVMSSNYNNEYVTLPTAETVPYWQGSGKGYEFSETSKIIVKIDKTNTITFEGVLGIMFDRQALGVCNSSKRVTTNYNAKGEFYNNYYKYDASYFNDLNENFILFFIAEKPTS